LPIIKHKKIDLRPDNVVATDKIRSSPLWGKSVGNWASSIDIIGTIYKNNINKNKKNKKNDQQQTTIQHKG
jgi:hypothetical protein